MAIIKGVYFNEELLDAISEKKLVVFVGAGVSMGAPTNLPDFKELTKQIAKGTTYSFNETESEDKFLGRLDFDGIKVHERASSILSELALQQNDLHSYILKLFTDSCDLKIVTTNYDKMLEKEALEAGFEIKVFNAPALPLGNDFNGIVHIHGNSDEPKNMVLTDADFGKAYLVEGYTSRFLVKLFQTYTVLFIGYSYNDIVIRYLTRALPDYQGKQRFIMTSNKKEQWETLGLTPIYYPKNEFIHLNKSIQELGALMRRGIYDWKIRLSAIAKGLPPIDPEIEDEVLRGLSKESTANFLIKAIHGEEWAKWLDDHKIFDNIFNPNSKLTTIDKLFSGWLAEEFVCKNSSIIFQLILKHKNNFNIDLISKISYKIISLDEEIRKEELIKWLPIICKNCNDHMLMRLSKLFVEKNLYAEAWILCENLIKYDITFKNNFALAALKGDKANASDFFEIECAFKTDAYCLGNSWYSFLRPHIGEFAISAVITCTKTIRDIDDTYKQWGQAFTYDMLFSKIINNEEQENKENHYVIMADILMKALTYLQNKDKELCLSWVKNHIKSPSILLKRIAIIQLGQTDLTADEKINIAINKIGLFDLFYERKEVFELVASSFDSAIDETQSLLITEIMRFKVENAENEELLQTQEYIKYNWLIWLKQKCNKNNKIEEALCTIKKSYPDFMPSEHPELSVYSSSACWARDISPVSEDELMKINLDEKYSWLKDYKGEDWKGPNREGLLNSIAKNCEKDFLWAIKIISAMTEHDDWRLDIWEYVFQGLSKNLLSVNQVSQLIEKIDHDELLFAKTLSISRWLYDLIGNETMKSAVVENENKLFDLSIKLWKNRQCYDELYDYNWPTRCLNNETGQITLVWIKLLAYQVKDNNLVIPPKYLDLFTKTITENNEKDGEFRCIIAGYFSFLFRLNSNWAKQHILPYFSSENNDVFRQAWEGFLLFSRLSPLIANVMSPIYLNAMAKIDIFTKDTRGNFINSYSVLLVYLIDQPNDVFIPKFFRYCDDGDRKNFALTISACLQDMNTEQKHELWGRWLEKYWESRLLGIPKPLSDSERQQMLKWLIYLEDLYPSAIQLTIKEKVNNLNGDCIYILDRCNNKFNYPTETAKLMIFLLTNIKGDIYFEDELKQIYENLNLADKQLKAELRDELLEFGIDVD